LTTAYRSVQGRFSVTVVTLRATYAVCRHNPNPILSDVHSKISPIETEPQGAPGFPPTEDIPPNSFSFYSAKQLC